MLEQEAEETYLIVNKYIDEENGKCEVSQNSLSLNLNNIEYFETVDKWRPISLRGIETNNSWIRVESEKDLPSADCDVFLYFKDGEIMCDRFLLNYKNFATINYIHVSHYQPITKPLQPLH